MSAANLAATFPTRRGRDGRHQADRRFTGPLDPVHCGAVALCALLALTLPARAAEPSAAVPPASVAALALQVQSLAGSCAACHGTAGRPAAGSAMPALAGMPAAYLGEQMRAFKSGARPATVMHQIAKGYGEPQIARLAAYFAAQAKAQP